MIRTSKQIIVVRKTFLINGETRKVRTGKMISQSAHASLKAIVDKFETHINKNAHVQYSLHTEQDTALFDWLKGSFTKICCVVETEEELLEVYNKAKAAGLICSLIVDSGRTEFNGVPTTTCCAVGPAWDDELAPITGNLKLF